MSDEKEQNDRETDESARKELEEEKEEEEQLKVEKKQKGKALIISEKEEEFESDEEKLTNEMIVLLKNARTAIAEENYLEAIKCYQDAAIAANMVGSFEREKIYLNRANEILKEHPELKEEGIELFKKRKLKAKVRMEEEKFSLGRLISHIIVAGIFIILIYSGIFSAIILQQIFEMGGSYDFTQLWGICVAIEIIGIILAYFLAKHWLSWGE